MRLMFMALLCWLLSSFHADNSIDVETMGKSAKKTKLSTDVTVEEFTTLGAELMNRDEGGSDGRVFQEPYSLRSQSLLPMCGSALLLILKLIWMHQMTRSPSLFIFSGLWCFWRYTPQKWSFKDSVAWMKTPFINGLGTWLRRSLTWNMR